MYRLRTLRRVKGRLKIRIHRLLVVILLSSIIFVAVLMLFTMITFGVSTIPKFQEETVGVGRLIICGRKSDSTPGLIIIHGGRASSEVAVEYCRSFYDKLGGLGFTIISIDYPDNLTLIDEVNYVVQAFEYIEARHLVDYERTCLIGASRGGYLALMAGAMTSVKCVVAAYAPTDLDALFNHARKEPGLWAEWGRYYTSLMRYIEGNGLNKTLVIRELSPLNNAGKIKGSVLLMHGLRDETIPPEHSVLLGEAFQKLGKKNYVVKLYEGETHGFSLLKGKPYEDLKEFLQRFLELENYQ
ncbi:MAG: prolyl oligopeptidase family serine peptidase [Nitrososphaerota archaeon]